MGPGEGDHLFESDCGCSGLPEWRCPFVSTSPSRDQLGEGIRTSFLCLRVGGESDLPG